MNPKYIGLDIGGTKCSVVLGSCNSKKIEVLDKIMFPTESNMGLEYTLNNFYIAMESILDNNQISTEDIMSIGVSCGGPLNSKTGRILSPPNLYGWNDVPITKIFEDRFGIKTYLQNDANACALAEWRFGAGMGLENVIFLTFGTGMGAGLILNGKLYDGTNGMAGEVGHIRLAQHGPVGYGKEGSFEGFCSGGGIPQIARAKVIEKLQKGESTSFCKSYQDLELLDAKTIANAADNGDEVAISVYEECAEYLGKGISILIDILNPQMIIIGSIYERSQNLLEDKVLASVNDESLETSARICNIVPASFGNKIGDIAALSVAVSGNMEFKNNYN